MSSAAPSLTSARPGNGISSTGCVQLLLVGLALSFGAKTATENNGESETEFVKKTNRE